MDYTFKEILIIMAAGAVGLIGTWFIRPTLSTIFVMQFITLVYIAMRFNAIHKRR